MSAMKLRAGLAAFAMAAGSACAQMQSTWTNPVSGVWSNAANWTPNTAFPNNNGPNTFDATIGVTGGTYTVSLDRDITIQTLNLTSPDATLDLTDFNLRLNTGFNLTNSTLTNAGGSGSITVGGAVVFDGATMLGVHSFESMGSMMFTGTGVDLMCDTDIHHQGNSCTWNGSGDILMERGAMFTNGPQSTFTIQNNQQLRYTDIGATPTFVNQGTLVKTAGGGSTPIVDVMFDNQGMLRVDSGTVSANQVAQVSGSTLTGGRWMVTGSSSIDLVGAAITTNAADITLQDPGSSFAAINGLTSNTVVGSLTLKNGRGFTTPGAFTNAGTVTANSSAFNVTGALTNSGVLGAVGSSGSVSAGSLSPSSYNPQTQTLTGGTYFANSGGTMQFPGADVRTLNANVTMSGAGSDIRNGGQSSLQDFNMIGSTGALSVQNGRNFQTSQAAGVFTVAPTGSLTVGSGTSFKVGGQNGPGSFFSVSNLSNGILTGGGFHIGGTLQFLNARITQVNGSLDLDGPGVHIIDQNGNDAMHSLGGVGTGGNLKVLNGQQLSVDGGLTLSGQMSVGGTGLDAPSQVNVPGAFMQDEGGELSLDGGQLNAVGTAPARFLGRTTGFGTISGNVMVDGVLAPGHTIGTLGIVGRLTIDPAAQVQIDLGGALPGQYDQLVVSPGAGGPGQITFFGEVSGTLSISLANGFVPSLGQTFDVLEFSERAGAFQQYLGLDLGNGLSLEPRYMSDRLELVVVPAPGAALVLVLAGVRRRRRTA